MEVRIGIQNVTREIAFESDQDAAQVRDEVAAAVDRGGLLTLADDKGRTFIVPVASIGFVQIGDSEKPRVGFGTS